MIKIKEKSTQPWPPKKGSAKIIPIPEKKIVEKPVKVKPSIDEEVEKEIHRANKLLNRTYVADISNGDRVKIVVIGGNQYCSLVSKGEDPDDVVGTVITKRSKVVALEKKEGKAKPSMEALEMTVQEIIDGLKAGQRICTPGGTLHSIKYCEGIADKSIKRKVIIK